MSFTIHTSISDSTLFLQGKLIDPAMDQIIMEQVLLISENSDKVNLNLKDLDYMNSSGLNTLLKAFTYLRNHNKELEIHEISESVKKLFIITKLHSIFTIKDKTE